MSKGSPSQHPDAEVDEMLAVLIKVRALVAGAPDAESRAVLASRVVQALTREREAWGEVRATAVGALREHHSQVEVARLLGVSTALVRQLERELKNLDPRYRKRPKDS